MAVTTCYFLFERQNSSQQAKQAKGAFPVDVIVCCSVLQRVRIPRSKPSRPNTLFLCNKLTVSQISNSQAKAILLDEDNFAYIAMSKDPHTTLTHTHIHTHTHTHPEILSSCPTIYFARTRARRLFQTRALAHAQTANFCTCDTRLDLFAMTHSHVALVDAYVT